MKIGEQVNTWIIEHELPVRAKLKVVRVNDPDYGLTEDEIADRNEFIRCELMKDFWLLMLIPDHPDQHCKGCGSGFFIGDYGVFDFEYSAFNTMDYHRTRRPFNRYSYAIKIILERVRDLAIMHSSISDPEGRLDTLRRYEAFVDCKFRDRLNYLVNRYRNEFDEEKACGLKQKIAVLNTRIRECQSIWERFAPPENWDR